MRGFLAWLLAGTLAVALSWSCGSSGDGDGDVDFDDIDDEPDSDRVDWRAVNAARMRGEVEDGEALVHVATSAAHPDKVRLEALDILSEWPRPHGQCRVIGNWRPCEHSSPEIVAQLVEAAGP